MLFKLYKFEAPSTLRWAATRNHLDEFEGPFGAHDVIEVCPEPPVPPAWNIAFGKTAVFNPKKTLRGTVSLRAIDEQTARRQVFDLLGITLADITHVSKVA